RLTSVHSRLSMLIPTDYRGAISSEFPLLDEGCSARKTGNKRERRMLCSIALQTDPARRVIPLAAGGATTPRAGSRQIFFPFGSARERSRAFCFRCGGGCCQQKSFISCRFGLAVAPTQLSP